MEKKKKYEAPQMEVAKVDAASIICTSTQATFSINNGEGYTEEEW